MYRLLLSLLITSFSFCHSQTISEDFKKDCQYAKNEVDEFTNKTIKATPYYNVKAFTGKKQKTYLSIKLIKNGNSNFILFDFIQNLGCANPYKSNQSYVFIKLKNNKIVKFYHKDKLDCKNGFTLASNITETNFKDLMSSEIKSIRLSGTELYQDITSLEWSTFFKDKLKCL